MWLLSFVSHRGSLQWDPSVIWLWPGALRRAPASPRPSILHRIPVLLSTTPLQEPEQPRHPVLRLAGVHAVGNVTGSTPTNMSDMLTVSLSSQCCCCCCSLPHLPLAAPLLLPDYCIVLLCPLSTHHPTLLPAVASHSVMKSCCYSAWRCFFYCLCVGVKSTPIFYKTKADYVLKPTG